MLFSNQNGRTIANWEISKPSPLQLNVILDELEVSSLDEPVAYEKFLDESNS